MQTDVARDAVEVPRRGPGTVAALAATSGAASALVAGLAESAGEHDGPASLDPHVAEEVLQLRDPALTFAAHAFTFAGSEVVVGAVALVVLAALLLRNEVVRGATFAVAMAGSAFLTVAVKLAVARPRPGPVDRLGPNDASFSFPSGHVLNSIVLLALLVWLLWPRVPAWRIPLAAAAVLMALAVAASRLYLGYHWMTDVIASGLVAVAWLSLVCLLSGPIRAVLTRYGVTTWRLAGRRTG